MWGYGALACMVAALACATKARWFPFLCLLVMGFGLWILEVNWNGFP